MCSVYEMFANRVVFIIIIYYNNIYSRYLAHLTKICSNKEPADELSTQLIQIKKPSSEKQSRLTLFAGRTVGFTRHSGRPRKRGSAYCRFGNFANALHALRMFFFFDLYFIILLFSTILLYYYNTLRGYNRVSIASTWTGRVIRVVFIVPATQIAQELNVTILLQSRPRAPIISRGKSRRTLKFGGRWCFRWAGRHTSISILFRQLCRKTFTEKWSLW